MNPIILRLLPLLGVLASALPARGASFAPGDPVVSLQRVEADSTRWSPRVSLVLRVRILHPLARGESTTDPWVLAPSGGWTTALRLVARDAAGTPVDWPFTRLAVGETEPAQCLPSSHLAATFVLDPSATGLAVPVGEYSVQAELSAADGAGWRGRVESDAISISVPGPLRPQLEVSPVLDGSLVAGWPWGVRVKVGNPFNTTRSPVPLPGGVGGWVSNLVISVQDAAGREVAWPWLRPILRATDRTSLDSGESLDLALFRLAANQTTEFVPGTYTIRASLSRVATATDGGAWTGTIESEPLSVGVEPSSAASEPARRQQHLLLQAEHALGEAMDIRSLASNLALGTDRRIETIHRAAEPLLRAESAAARAMLEQPEFRTAWLLSRIFLAEDDPAAAGAWARLAVELEANSPAPDAVRSADPAPETPPTQPGFGLLLWRQAIEAIPDVPDALLTPELQLALTVYRGTEPEPKTLAEQDPYFALDPRGQWATSARASTEYGSANYSAARATGAPDVRFYGDSVNAWATKLANTGEEWIELTFAAPVRAAALRVRQNFNPGAMARVDLWNSSGQIQTVFSGTDTNIYPRASIGWFTVRFPTTDQPIARVRLTLDTARVRGWNEIDGVQLVAGDVAAVDAPRLVISTPVAGAGELIVANWPAGFLLERASSLAPPNWAPFAVRPPVTIPLEAPMGFFRLVQEP